MNVNKVYEDCKTQLDAQGDLRYCGVIALSVVAGISVVEAAERLRKFGRRRGKGTPRFVMQLAIESLGLKHEVLVNFGKNEAGNRVSGWKAAKTVRSLARVVPQRGTFLVNTSRHVLAIKNGKVCDWTDGRLHRIQRIVRISA